MSERPTPETERIKGALHTNWNDLMNHARKLESERDEARAKLDDWENAAKHVESDHSDEVHCSCVPVLRKLLNDSKKERDEARAVLQEIEAARWHTACELRRIATGALGSKI
jgi:hypothetical protein